MNSADPTGNDNLTNETLPSVQTLEMVTPQAIELKLKAFEGKTEYAKTNIANGEMMHFHETERAGRNAGLDTQELATDIQVIKDETLEANRLQPKQRSLEIALSEEEAEQNAKGLTRTDRALSQIVPNTFGFDKRRLSSVFSKVLEQSHPVVINENNYGPTEDQVRNLKPEIENGDVMNNGFRNALKQTLSNELTAPLDTTELTADLNTLIDHMPKVMKSVKEGITHADDQTTFENMALAIGETSFASDYEIAGLLIGSLNGENFKELGDAICDLSRGATPDEIASKIDPEDFMRDFRYARNSLVGDGNWDEVWGNFEKSNIVTSIDESGREVKSIKPSQVEAVAEEIQAIKADEAMKIVLQDLGEETLQMINEHLKTVRSAGIKARLDAKAISDTLAGVGNETGDSEYAEESELTPIDEEVLTIDDRIDDLGNIIADIFEMDFESMQLDDLKNFYGKGAALEDVRVFGEKQPLVIGELKKIIAEMGLNSDLVDLTKITVDKGSGLRLEDRIDNHQVKVRPIIQRNEHGQLVLVNPINENPITISKKFIRPDKIEELRPIKLEQNTAFTLSHGARIALNPVDTNTQDVNTAMQENGLVFDQNLQLLIDGNLLIGETTDPKAQQLKDMLISLSEASGARRKLIMKRMAELKKGNNS